MVNRMTVYIDVLVVVNFLFDFFLLLTINVALKRFSLIRRLVLASLFGEVTLLSLFRASDGSSPRRLSPY